MNSIPIIIPAYEPDNRMIDLIRHIRSDYDGDIIIVNDGSDASFDTEPHPVPLPCIIPL